MKRFIIKCLLIVRKARRNLKSNNVESKIKDKEDLILELLTKDLTPLEITKLKISIDKRFKIKCLELNKQIKKDNLTLTNYLKCCE